MMRTHSSIRGASSVCIQPKEDKPASSCSDNDERSAQLDACGAQANNESADTDAIRNVDQLSLVPTPYVKPRLARPSEQRKRKRQVSSTKNNSNYVNTNDTSQQVRTKSNLSASGSIFGTCLLDAICRIYAGLWEETDHLFVCV